MRRTAFTSLCKIKMGKLPMIRLLRALIIGIPILSFGWGNALSQCALVCNDNVNVSLPGPLYNCEVEITVDMLMDDTSGCVGLTVTIMDLDGNVIPSSPYVNSSHIGETFIYKVTDPSNGNSCWGTLDVEDKLGPTFTNCDDATLLCLEDITPELDGGDAPSPDIDDCSNFDYFYEDLITLGDCNTNYAAIISRTWTGIDEFGNTSNCYQTFIVEKMPLDQFTPECPENLVFQCDTTGQPSTHPDTTGYPFIVVGDDTLVVIPGGNYSCQMAASYQDEVFEICGGGIKILRTWNVYDWCLPTIPGVNPWTCIQIIKVNDEIPPVITCVPEIIEGSVSTACEAWVYLPPANVTDECSGVEVKIITPFGVVNGNGGLTPVPIPVGEHAITYVATDECGNVSTCPSWLKVIDDTPPVTVCDEFTTVSLTADGTALVQAVVFDDGSSDNCGIDRFEISRMPSACDPNGTPFNDFAEFFCCDVGESIIVVFRVFDLAGNYNDCMVEVLVQDKIDPQVSCPPNKTIECNDPIPPVVAPTFSDNCPGATWDYIEDNFIGPCGVGTIFRHYTVTDAAGRTASCTQQITVINSNPFNLSNIAWPFDFVTFQCGFSLEPGNLPPGFDKPITANDVCDMVAVTYTDQLLPNNPPACYKILRNWIVIDWCQFDPNDPNTGGIWEHTQVLKAEDADNPEVDCPGDLVFDSFHPDCGLTSLSIDPIVITDCSENLDFSVIVDYDSDGDTDAYGSGPDISGDYPFGEHTITFTVKDLCGNTTTCTFKLTVKDGKKPTPVCINGIAADLMSDPGGDGGIIELTAEMFNKESFDNCTDQENLEFSLTPTTFRCVNLGTNIVTLWVTDEAGNSDFCETYVIIQDNMGVCPFNNPNISGTVETEVGIGVGDVIVEVSGNGPSADPVSTEDNGFYEFFDFETGYDYTFTPYRDDNPTDGVTTFDLVLITKHILNTTLLDSPYKLIAADVNKSGTITTIDIVELRKLILNIIPTFNNNTSWRFIDAKQVFSDPADPFAEDIHEFYNINNLGTDVTDVDFVAVKVGDVNNSVTPNNLLSVDDRTAEDQLTFLVEDATLEPGEEHSVSFKARDFSNILGFQFTLEFDHEVLEFVEMTPGALKLTNANFGFNMLDEGILTTSWNDAFNAQEGQAKNTPAWDDTELFSLTFRANTKTHLSDLLHIHSKITKAEAYTSDSRKNLIDSQLLGIELQFEGSGVKTKELHLYQNTPNPFSEATVIGFTIPEAAEATLTITDISGKTLKVVSGNFSKGYNQIRINSTELRGSGVLYYRLASLTGTATKKMILVK